MNQPMFVIVDPVNPTNNTARNSFRTPDVLKSFRDAFKRLKSLIYNRFQATSGASDALADEETKTGHGNGVAAAGLVQVTDESRLKSVA